MIAIWMGYTLATGVLLLMLGALLDRLFRVRRWPTRHVWVAMMIGIVTLGVAALALQSRSASRPLPRSPRYTAETMEHQQVAACSPQRVAKSRHA